MALSDTLKRGQIGPSLRGQFYQYQRNGKWVTAAWPKPRKKPPTPGQAAARKLFSDVCKAIKSSAGEIQSFHRANAMGTPMLPRDTLMAALYGNGPTIKTYDGKVIKPMANRYLASTVLDALAWEEGAMFFRGKEYWEPIPPGQDGQVLSYVAAEKKPMWIEAGGGGMSAPAVTSVPTASGDSSTNWCGNTMVMAEARTLRAMSWATESPAGYDNFVAVYFCDEPGYVTSEACAPVLSQKGAGGLQLMRHEFAVPINIPADQNFVVLVGRTTNQGGVGSYIRWASLAIANFPVKRGPLSTYANQGAIPNGYYFGRGNAPAFAINLEFE